MTAAIVAATAFAGSGSTSKVATKGAFPQADCSPATATQLVNQNRLNNFLLPNPVGQVLCGPFTGSGSEAMAVTMNAPTCWSPQGWAVFRLVGGAWQLVMVRELVFIVAPLVAVGSDIRETQPVFRPGDARCLPSGGTHARLWHWDGTRFVAGPWKQVTEGTPLKVAEFYSPSGNLGCELGDDPAKRGSYAYCQSWKHPHSVRMGLDGRLRICRGGTIKTTHCLGNPGENTPTLGYGKQITVGRFRCFSLRSGVKCIVMSSGRGFVINAAGVTKIG